LNGVGTKAVNALSGYFKARSVRDGKFKEAEFSAGKLIAEKDGSTEERNGTLIQFKPDHEIFPKFVIKQEYVERRLWMYAYLNSGLSLYFNGQRYYSKNGLMDLIDLKPCRRADVNHHHYSERLFGRQKILKLLLVTVLEYFEVTLLQPRDESAVTVENRNRHCHQIRFDLDHLIVARGCCRRLLRGRRPLVSAL
jgi:hypothetical protein